MGNVIWKYPLEGKQQDIRMPVGARILTVQVQNDTPTLWALVNPLNPLYPRRILQAWTGEVIVNAVDYIGTCQLPNGLVVHVFEWQDAQFDALGEQP